MLCAAAYAAAPATALAQSSVLVPPPELPDYDRGRNVSVRDKSRPDYDALGIRRGSFLIYPRLQLGGGYSDNVYLTPLDARADAYATLAPSVFASSDWSRHQLSLGANLNLLRYANNAPRNQDEWSLNALGRVDMTSALAVTAEAQAAKVQESLFSGAVDAEVAALSAYQRRTASVRAQYVSGRMRATLTYDLNSFDFDDVRLSSGSALSQRDRNRSIHRVTAQLEHAFSPSLSVYGQLAYAATHYGFAPAGLPSRSSRGYRAIVGLNLDLSAFFRGSVGVGYLARDYRSAIYGTASGPLIEGRLEYFPTELTTLTGTLRRVIDDTNIGGTAAFFDNYAALRIDHELRLNLLLNAEAAYTRQDFVDSPLGIDIVRGSIGARYLVSRDVELTAAAAYAHRQQDGTGPRETVNEMSAEVGVMLKR